MAAPSINLATDSLGLGGMFGALTGNSQGTEICGRAPNCLFGSDCKERKAAYQACNQKVADSLATRNTKSTGIQTSTIFYIGAAVILLVLIFLIIRRR